MKNKKRIMAVALAAVLTVSNAGGNIYSKANAAETVGEEVVTEASGEAIVSDAGIEAVETESDEAKEASVDDGMEQENHAEDNTEEEENEQTKDIKDEAEKADSQEEKNDEEKTEDGDAVKEYIVVAKNKRAYERTEDEYGNLEEGTEEEGEDGQLLEENNILVAEMTGEEAEELEEKRDILLVEENITLEGCSEGDEEEVPDISDSEVQKKLEMKEETMEVLSEDHSDDQWDTDMINANGEEYAQAADEVRVAVMDTGVCATEEIDVEKRVNFIEGEEDIEPLFEDISGHGTSVAAVIGAKDNGRGITGINPNARLYSVKVLDDDKKASLSSVVKGFYWCMENDVDIINMSFGTGTDSELLRNVVKEAADSGILMVAAAGNCGSSEEGSTVQYPAAYDEVIAVGAASPEGTVSDFSSTGEEIELMAPGELIPGIGFFDEVIETDGTSMAAPHVTGVASVLWAKDRSRSAEFIRNLMKAGAKSMEDGARTGSGVVDLDYSLEIYEDFAEAYVEDSADDVRENVAPNEDELEVFDEAEIRANWSGDSHAYAVKMAKKYCSDSDEGIEIIKIGVRLPDNNEYGFSFSGGKSLEETESFHGHKNYIDNYIFMMNIANDCWKNGINQALEHVKGLTAVFPGRKQIYIRLKSFTEKGNWNKVLGEERNTKKNKARILVGMAVHIAMDSYAHRACINLGDNKNEDWVRITNKNQRIEELGFNNAQDNKECWNARWQCAKAIACDILQLWPECGKSDSIEFYQPDLHPKRNLVEGFCMEDLSKNAKEADPGNYDDFKSWFKSRTP